jgi:hypothetical protein
MVNRYIYLEIQLDGLPTTDNVRNDFRTLRDGYLEHVVISELRENVDNVVEIGQNEFLEGFEFVGLGWGFAENRRALVIDGIKKTGEEEERERCVQFAVGESFVRDVVFEDDWGVFECGGDEFVIN